MTLDPWTDPMAPSALPCRTTEHADLWFAEHPAAAARAQALCEACPIRSACLAGAVEREEPWGVWGGKWFDHGVPVERRRGPGRPRKHPVAA